MSTNHCGCGNNSGDTFDMADVVEALHRAHGRNGDFDDDEEDGRYKVLSLDGSSSEGGGESEREAGQPVTALTPSQGSDDGDLSSEGWEGLELNTPPPEVEAQSDVGAGMDTKRDQTTSDVSGAVIETDKLVIAFITENVEHELPKKKKSQRRRENKRKRRELEKDGQQSCNPAEVSASSGFDKEKASLISIKERNTTTPASSPGPIDAYFKLFPSFDYKPSPDINLTKCFRRLMKHRGIVGGTEDYEHERERFQRAMDQEFTLHFGDGDFSLDAWRRLCALVGIQGALELGSISKCKKELEKVYINLVDLVEVIRQPEGLPLEKRKKIHCFASLGELRRYCHRQKKYFRKQNAKNSVLKGLLKRVL